MSFQQGLSGLNAAARNLDVIGNNVANASTVGYKGSVSQFSDVFAASLGGAGGTQIGIGASLTNVMQSFNQGNISVTNSPLDLAINGQGFFQLDSAGSTVFTRNGQYLLDKDGYIVNAAGANLLGYPADATGQIQTAMPSPLQIQSNGIPAQASTSADLQVNLDSRKPVIASAFDLNDPSTYTAATSIAVYDSAGDSHTLSVYFVKSAAKTWNVYGAQNGTSLGSLGQLVFNNDGTLNSGASTVNAASLTSVNGNSPFTVALDYTGTTQFGSPFGVTALSQDGYASGQLTGYAIGPDGVILGRYSNGQSRAQGQVMICNFNSPSGLQPLGSNNWAETSESGIPKPGTPGSTNLGMIQAGALEDSNVDLTQELVNMITAQRVYQANAQTIKTQDSVLQTLVNMR